MAWITDLNTWKAQTHGIKQCLGFAFHKKSLESLTFIINLYNQDEKVSLKDLNHDKKCMRNVLGIDLYAMYLLTQENSNIYWRKEPRQMYSLAAWSKRFVLSTWFPFKSFSERFTQHFLEESSKKAFRDNNFFPSWTNSTKWQLLRKWNLANTIHLDLKLNVFSEKSVESERFWNIPSPFLFYSF